MQAFLQTELDNAAGDYVRSVQVEIMMALEEKFEIQLDEEGEYISQAQALARCPDPQH